MPRGELEETSDIDGFGVLMIGRRLMVSVQLRIMLRFVFWLIHACWRETDERLFVFTS